MKSDAEAGVQLGDNRDVALGSQALELVELARVKTLAQYPERRSDLFHPGGQSVRILPLRTIRVSHTGLDRIAAVR